MRFVLALAPEVVRHRHGLVDLGEVGGAFPSARGLQCAANEREAVLGVVFVGAAGVAIPLLNLGIAGSARSAIDETLLDQRPCANCAGLDVLVADRNGFVDAGNFVARLLSEVVVESVADLRQQNVVG